MSVTRLLATGCLFAAALLGEEIPRAVQVAEPPAQAAGEEKVISRSKQFRIQGGDGRERGVVAIVVEETKDEFLELTGEKDEWKVPVSVRLHGKQGDPLRPRTVSMRLIVVEGVRELRIDVHLGKGIERELERLRRTVTSAMVYERALRELPADGSGRPLAVPAWITEGLLEAAAWSAGRSDRALYEALFRNGGLFKIDQLFAVDEAGFETMDGATRAAFRVSSGALVMALLEQPQGREAFRAFIIELAPYEGEMPGLLRKHFPELNLSETSLAKLWMLQLANKGGVNLLTDVLTITQTERALDEALRLRMRTEEGILVERDFAAWPELAALDEAKRVEAVRATHEAVVRLSFRCFPSYRPLLAEYQIVLDSIAKNTTGEVPATLLSLEETRVTMVARANRARDYLDWFEITRARETSGAFDDYLRLKERLKENKRQRNDNLSKYLDRMDAIFHRGETKSPYFTDLPR